VDANFVHVAEILAISVDVRDLRRRKPARFPLVLLVSILASYVVMKDAWTGMKLAHPHHLSA